MKPDSFKIETVTVSKIERKIEVLLITLLLIAIFPKIANPYSPLLPKGTGVLFLRQESL